MSKIVPSFSIRGGGVKSSITIKTTEPLSPSISAPQKQEIKQEIKQEKEIEPPIIKRRRKKKQPKKEKPIVKESIKQQSLTFDPITERWILTDDTES